MEYDIWQNLNDSYSNLRVRPKMKNCFLTERISTCCADIHFEKKELQSSP